MSWTYKYIDFAIEHISSTGNTFIDDYGVMWVISKFN